MKIRNIALWLLRIVAAAVMLQTLYFKFTAHPMSVALFTILGMEPYGRITIGVGELIASVLILYPRTTWLGALFGLGLMAGALFSHLTKLGIFFGGDIGLFLYAVIVFVFCTAMLLILRKEVFGRLNQIFYLKKDQN